VLQLQHMLKHAEGPTGDRTTFAVKTVASGVKLNIRGNLVTTNSMICQFFQVCAVGTIQGHLFNGARPTNPGVWM